MMIFSEMQVNLCQSINKIETTLSTVSDFSVYSHISGDAAETYEITLIVSPKPGASIKSKLKEKDIDKYIELCVKKNKFTNPEDKMFRKMVDFISINKKIFEVPREKLLYLLKRQDAGFKLNKWITQKVQYSFQDPSKPQAYVMGDETESAHFLILCGYAMQESGLLLMIEDDLSKIIQEKYAGTEGIPVIEKIKENPEEQVVETISTKIQEENSKKIEEEVSTVLEKSDDVPKDKKKIVQKMGLFGPRPTLAKDASEIKHDNKPSELENNRKNSEEQKLSAAEKQNLARKRLVERRMKRNSQK